jgi:hypothetical protein
MNFSTENKGKLIYFLAILAFSFAVFVTLILFGRIFPYSSTEFGNWAMWIGALATVFAAVGTVGTLVQMKREQADARVEQKNRSLIDLTNKAIEIVNQDIINYNSIVLKINQHKLSLLNLSRELDFFEKNNLMNNIVKKSFIIINNNSISEEKKNNDVEKTLWYGICGTSDIELKLVIKYMSTIPFHSIYPPKLESEFFIDVQIFISQFYNPNESFEKIVRLLMKVHGSEHTKCLDSMKSLALKVSNYKEDEMLDRNIINEDFYQIMSLYIKVKIDLSHEIYFTEDITPELQINSLSALESKVVKIRHKIKLLKIAEVGWIDGSDTFNQTIQYDITDMRQEINNGLNRDVFENKL